MALIVPQVLCQRTEKLPMAMWQGPGDWESRPTWHAEYPVENVKNFISTPNFQGILDLANMHYNWVIEQENAYPKGAKGCHVAVLYDPAEGVVYASTIPRTMRRALMLVLARDYQAAPLWFNQTALFIGEDEGDAHNHPEVFKPYDIRAEDAVYFTYETTDKSEAEEASIARQYPAGAIVQVWGSFKKSSIKKSPHHHGSGSHTDDLETSNDSETDQGTKHHGDQKAVSQASTEDSSTPSESTPKARQIILCKKERKPSCQKVAKALGVDFETSHQTQEEIDEDDSSGSYDDYEKTKTFPITHLLAQCQTGSDITSDVTALFGGSPGGNESPSEDAPADQLNPMGQNTPTTVQPTGQPCAGFRTSSCGVNVTADWVVHRMAFGGGIHLKAALFKRWAEAGHNLQELGGFSPSSTVSAERPRTNEPGSLRKRLAEAGHNLQELGEVASSSTTSTEPPRTYEPDQVNKRQIEPTQDASSTKPTLCAAVTMPTAITLLAASLFPTPVPIATPATVPTTAPTASWP